MCQPAMDLILSKPYDPFTMKILRQSECGRAGRYLKVRCEDISVPCTTPDNRNGKNIVLLYMRGVAPKTEMVCTFIYIEYLKISG